MEYYPSNTKEQTNDTHNSMVESQKHFAKWKEPDPKGDKSYNSIYLIILKEQNYQISGCQGLGMEKEMTTKRQHRQIWGGAVMELFCIFIVVMDTWLYALIKSHSIVYHRSLLYANK